MKQIKLEQFNNFDKTNSNNNNYLTDICAVEYQKLNTGPLKEKIMAEFYPYSNLKLTVRKRNDKLLIRMSDILTDAPQKVLASAANRIISQFLNIKCSHEPKAIYNEYIHSELMRQRITTMRQARAGKKITGPEGKYFDLDECFKKINNKYFKSGISKPTLSWSAQQSKFRMGHYDSDLDTLVVSQQLDSKRTPKYVVEYVVFHELLHKLHPGSFANGRRQIHTTEFKRDEKLFDEYKHAKKWLKQK